MNEISIGFQILYVDKVVNSWLFDPKDLKRLSNDLKMTLIGSGLRFSKIDILYLRFKKLKDLFSNQTCDDKNVRSFTKYHFCWKTDFLCVFMLKWAYDASWRGNQIIEHCSIVSNKFSLTFDKPLLVTPAKIKYGRCPKQAATEYAGRIQDGPFTFEMGHFGIPLEIESLDCAKCQN